MDTTDIVLKTYEFVDEIKSSNTYKRIIELNKLMETDIELCKQIELFNEVKLKYSEIVKYSHYHPDYEKISKDLSDIKTKLYQNELVKELKRCEKMIQEELNDFSHLLGKIVSDRIKTPNAVVFRK